MTFKNRLIYTFTLFSFFFICSLVSYFDLWNVFFQQDEWFAFGEIIYANHVGALSLIGISGFHFVPLATYFIYIFYNIFNLHYEYYAILALLIHTLNILLVYILGVKIFKKRILSVLTSILFAFADTGQQAVTWFATTFSVLPETAFVLLSTIAFVDYVQSGKKSRFFISLIALIVALLFKEDAILLPFIYILILLVMKKKSLFQDSIKIGGVWLIYFVMRVIVQVQFDLHAKSKSVQVNYPYAINLLEHVLIFPIKGLMQALLSQKLLLEIAHFVVNINQSFFSMVSPINSLDLFAELYMVNIILGASFLIFLFIFLYFFVHSSIKDKRLSLFFLFFSLSFLFPLIFLPPALDIESRHLYLPSIGSSMLFTLLWTFYFQRIKDKEMKAILLIGFFLFVFYNLNLNHGQILELQQQSKPRIAFVDQVSKTYIMLPAKVIFLAQGDPLPLQSGPGQTIEVLLSQKNDLSPFLKENFLWDTNNGYKEVGNKGFGFFYDKEQFMNVYSKYHLKPINVISFTWDNKTAKLTDTTIQTRKELYGQQ